MSGSVRVGDIVDVASMARYLDRAVGVVTATDDRGVHVTFDRDINGLRTCYATYRELTQLPVDELNEMPTERHLSGGAATVQGTTSR